jgi:hypothetical protein
MADARTRASARLAAGREALYWIRILARSGRNLVGEVLAGHGTFYEWEHYPPGDVFDPDSASQWYYHAHPKEERPGEHGHFHLFRRDGADTIHLVAIGMNAAGLPVHLFTTNRWVTGERIETAARVARLVDGFDVALAVPSWPVNRWLGAMLRFYAPEIRALLAERDRVIEATRVELGSHDILEDRRLEVTSMRAIDLARDVAALEQALGAGASDVEERHLDIGKLPVILENRAKGN